MMTEKELQEEIRRLAKMFGWIFYHTFDSRHSAEGYPDVVLVKNGFLIFWELKSEKGRVSAVQAVWLYALRKTGADEVRVIRPSDLEHVVETLRDRGR